MALVTPVLADWKDEIGYTRLQLLAGAELPFAPTQGFTQVEAPENTTNYTPDTTNSNFTGKTFALRSGPSGVSSHATTVANNFYGNTTSLPSDNIPVDLFNANGYIGMDFLKTGSFNEPAVETHAVQNHSWIAATYSSADEANQRLDYAINRDGFVCVVGENNGNTTVLPDLLGQSYHTISVGLVNGSHSAGFTTLDGIGRIKPDIVAPDGATSFATPMVSSAAGLLYSKLASLAPTLAAPDKPRVIKALLLASATKDTVTSWSNTSARPLDIRYGAGELNVNHAYNDLRAGRATASNSTFLKSRGWAAESVSGNSAKTYYFTIPAGAASPPFCAALTWHRVITDGRSGSNWGNLTTSIANLNLRLYQANGFSPGSAVSDSLSTVDNVELVYQSALAPGNYALVVENASAAATDYGLAWHSLPAVSIVATSPTAREINQQQGLITITRNGDTTLPLYVPIWVSASALANSGFQPLPSSVTIPAGQSSTTLPVIPIADDLAEGGRSVTVAIASDFGLVRDPGQTALVTIEDKPFDAWRFANFTSVELNDSGTSGANADPDGDQLPNLIEYAMNLDPKNSGVAPVSSGVQSDYLSISATKNAGATDITWSAEVCADLVTWSPAVVLTNTTTTFAARDNITTSTAEKRMIRLRITRP
ncbi:MAG: S8 family serine peptidase [Luteolibacter sp.]